MAHPPAPHPEVVSAAERAGLTYQRSVGEDFEPSAVAYAQGAALELAGAHEEALKRWLEALEVPTARGWPALMNGVTRAGRRLGREREVAARLEGLAARLVELHLWRGHLLRTSGDPEAALAPLEAAWVGTTGELRFTALSEMLQALVDLGRVEQAIHRCREGVVALPERALALRVSLGGLLTRAGRPEEALVELDGVVALAPRLGVAHLNRGAALLALGRREEATAALGLAQNLDVTTYPTARRLLGAT